MSLNYSHPRRSAQAPAAPRIDYRKPARVVVVPFDSRVVKGQEVSLDARAREAAAGVTLTTNGQRVTVSA